MSGESRNRLTSWKEIATHLRREVRTVIRWEKERGLPVHRVPGGQGRSVFAFTDELDRWAAGDLQSQAPENGAPKPRPWLAPRAWRAMAVAATVLVVGAVAVRLVTAWPTPEITDLRLGADTLTAMAGPRTLWSFHFPHPIVEMLRRRTALADIDGDGRADAIASVDLMATPGGQPSAALYAIDSRGRLAWQASVDDSFSFASGGFDSPWQPDDVMAFRRGNTTRVAWALHHYTWWPSVLAVFDGKGQRLGTFVNAGWIRTSHATADGRVIVTGGFSNSRDAAAFALLDADRPSGSSPEDEGSPYACRDCPAGRPLGYIVVRWSDVATDRTPDGRDVTVIPSPNGGVALHALQRRGTDAIVELSPSLSIVRAAFSDNFWDEHRRLEADGTLTHGREACPFRDGPIVREWTPQSGWRDVPRAPPAR